MAPVDPFALEALTLRAWPPVELGRVGDWSMAASDGFAMRINACWPLGEADDPGAAIDTVEAWYGRRGLPTRFKLADGAKPAGLEALLLARGYRLISETLVMAGPVAGAFDPETILAAAPDDGFAAVFVGAGGGEAEAAERLAALGRMPPPAVFARLEADGAPVAIGACAVEGEWAGLFAMRTIAGFRRRGLARRLAAVLLAQAARLGARRAYLQVEASNAAAIALYRGLGFETAYAYRYAVSPAADRP